MKRIVAPKRWSQMNRVEHPPLMMKQLFQGVCGGLRWLDTKALAQHIASRAIEDGYPSTPAIRQALNVKRAPLRKRRLIQRTALKAELPLTSSSNALTVTGGLSVRVTKEKRLVSYDVLDCTLGGGYHSGAVLENGGPYTRVVALDCDQDAGHSAKELAREFGGDRFRFYCCRMSEAKSMFGERAFDAIMIDSGPSDTQLADPERGFLINDENSHYLDMRYGMQTGLNALTYLNTVPQHTLAATLSFYGILAPGQAMKMARAVRHKRPFVGSQDVLACVEAAGDELPEEGWQVQKSRRRSPMSWRFLTSLRCIVNNEMFELKQAIENALLMLRDNGRLVVFSRLEWEERLVREIAEAHPHALLCYTEVIDTEEVETYGFTRHTKMWVITRVAISSYVLKNATSLTEEKIRDSSLRWLSGMYAGQTYGFPANNFTFENLEPKERLTMQRNSRAPPHDDGLGDA
ncbi:putative MraW methylase family [Trypanosoma vivax]|uniref:Putative S-adenosyl-methyltransferase mraW-like protein n=1 Tax=Trypanosoma vivax (strain Y486) TaxID=1055687 RepID=G0U0P9_TRYVY|nr:putative S-adenosyl-methyltransferase mraW-like protein [Trypanosoma vivax]KAH8609183.1 putative MraW methylase family [Trypanosoma vivax]CCC49648.1 putative S-adenosyl-methyltransferase mraW-like protein [Trypanosoma vivax Y486]